MFATDVAAFAFRGEDRRCRPISTTTSLMSSLIWDDIDKGQTEASIRSPEERGRADSIIKFTRILYGRISSQSALEVHLMTRPPHHKVSSYKMGSSC